MKIHHFSLPALDPAHVSAVLAEIFGGRILPLAHLHGTRLVHSGDPDGTAIEVWPAGLRGGAGDKELSIRDLPLPEAWPHHAYVTSEHCDSDRIVAIFRREGWRVEKVHNGPPHAGFSLVRGWIENQTTIELGGSEMREQYERHFQSILQTQAAPAHAE